MLGGSLLKRNDMLQSYNLPSSSDIKWEKYKQKKYLHFDRPLPLSNEVKKNLLNPEWVTQHSFWPSIHFQQTFNKYVPKENYQQLKAAGVKNRELKEKKKKVRDIYFSAHIDSYIFKYYGDLLNMAYNEYAKKQDIDDAILAYRNNKQGMSTIEFCYEVFEKLFQFENAIIFSIDFTKYFDNINHLALKNNIQEVLHVPRLPKDLYTVFKNLTKFTYVKKTDIDKFLTNKYGTSNQKKLQQMKIQRIMSASEFQQFKQTYMYKHKKPYGIPQGSGMSAVCSNIHLIHFDQEVQQWVNTYQGVYKRYCDDILIILPNVSSSNWIEYQQQLYHIIKKYEAIGLHIQENKTVVRFYEDGIIKNTQFEQSTLDYLGFVTDGIYTRIREKSLFKFYSRAYKKARQCKNITAYFKSKGKTRLYGRQSLYRIYTHLGKKSRKYGNFITYNHRAHKKMKLLKKRTGAPVISHIQKQTKRHWGRIQKKLY